MAEILIPSAAQLPWWRVREGIAAVLRAMAPLARIHSSWELSFNLEESAARITVRAEDVAVGSQADVGKVHSWMVGVEEADYLRNANGDLPDIGGGGFEWLLTFVVWGFFDYQLMRTDGKRSQQVAEEEVELVASAMILNPELGLDAAYASSLRQVRPLVFRPIDIHDFTEGVQAHVAQGSMQVRIERGLF